MYHPPSPSLTSIYVIPWNVTSVRDAFPSTMVLITGIFIPIISMLEVIFMVLRAANLALPPIAWICFAMISSAVCALTVEAMNNNTKINFDNTFMLFGFDLSRQRWEKIIYLYSFFSPTAFATTLAIFTNSMAEA